jgi:hypothetical protein
MTQGLALLCSYVALRLLGIDQDDAGARRARAWVRLLLGSCCMRLWTKLDHRVLEASSQCSLPPPRGPRPA